MEANVFTLTNFYLFLLAALVILLTPGPAVLYIMARSLDQGRVAGLISVVGIEIGNFVHVLAAVLGLSAILMSSALAFATVKYLGAAYLIYLGLHRLFAHDSVHSVANLQPRSRQRILFQAVLVAVLNPKTALFFFAFLPQFIDPSQGSVTGQLLAFGCLFVLMAIVTDGLYALLVGTLGKWLKSTRFFQRIERYVTATVYICLGVTAGLAEVKH
jgi:threonine/homoserine/homoserine lactone efflux protein